MNVSKILNAKEMYDVRGQRQEKKVKCRSCHRTHMTVRVLSVT